MSVRTVRLAGTAKSRMAEDRDEAVVVMQATRWPVPMGGSSASSRVTGRRRIDLACIGGLAPEFGNAGVGRLEDAGSSFSRNLAVSLPFVSEPIPFTLETMQIDPNAVNEVAKVANSDAGKALTLPAAHEIGLLLGEVANIFRFYTTENLGKVLTRWDVYRKAQEKPLTERDIKKVMPLLQAAAMQSDEELQERWAALLESAATDDPNYLPSFATTLSVLTSEQVKYLDRLWEFSMQPLDVTSMYPPGILPVEDIKLIEIFDPSINTGINAAEVKIHREEMSPEQHANYERLLHARMVIEDLIGLKIIGAIQSTEAQRNYYVNDVVLPVHHSGTKLITRYAFNHYGLAFIRAVAPRAKQHAEP